MWVRESNRCRISDSAPQNTQGLNVWRYMGRIGLLNPGVTHCLFVQVLQVVCLGDLIPCMVNLFIPFCSQSLKSPVMLGLQVRDLFLYPFYEMCSNRV